VSVIALLLEVLKLSKFQVPEYKLYAFSNMSYRAPISALFLYQVICRGLLIFACKSKHNGKKKSGIEVYLPDEW
jgi:hypothetical protein